MAMAYSTGGVDLNERIALPCHFSNRGWEAIPMYFTDAILRPASGLIIYSWGRTTTTSQIVNRKGEPLAVGESGQPS